MNDEELIKEARRVLERNDRGDFSTPSPGQYPHQWNWDSALCALGWAHMDMGRARAEVHSLLRAQWRDGMVPHIIYPTGASDYFPPPSFWQTEGLAHAGVIPSSGLTQPPILATVVRMLHERAPQDESAFGFLRAVYPRLLAWHRWFHTSRAVDGTGLPCLIHPWESGTDNSPRWAAALDRITPEGLPPFKRRDQVHVRTDERPFARDYERFVYLIVLGRQAGWDSHRLLAESPFLVQDVMFCSILHEADADLLALAEILGEDKAEIESWRARTEAAFEARFWSEERGLYLDYDVRAGRPIPVNTCATFAPLYAGLSPAARAEQLMVRHWASVQEYAPDSSSLFRLPSVAKNEPGYDPKRYWCGPAWIITNWLIRRGLLRYGYAAEAEELRSDSLRLLRGAGCREYYDPRDGSGLGATEFCWSAALAMELVAPGEGGDA